MTVIILDFAGVRDFEQEAGAPILWSSREQFDFVDSIDTAQLWLESWLDGTLKAARQLHSLAVRWGDPRIDSILDLWRAELGDWETTAEGDRFIHGRHINVLLPTSIWQLHVIPKSLGTPDTGSREDPMPLLEPEFNPRLYHSGGNAKVIAWNEPAWKVETMLEMFHSGLVFYAEVAEHFLSWHMGVYLPQPTDGSKVAVLL